MTQDPTRPGAQAGADLGHSPGHSTSPDDPHSPPPAPLWPAASDGQTPDPMSFTVADVCESYLEARNLPNRPSTMLTMRASYRNHIKPLIGHIPAAKLHRAHVAEFRNAVYEGKSASIRPGRRRPIRVRGGQNAANAAVATLSAAFAMGMSDGMCTRNPAARIRRFSVRQITRSLSDEEMARFRDALCAEEKRGRGRPQAFAAIRLIAMTGCRKSEILSLTPEQCDRPSGLLHLDGKCGKRDIPVGPAVFDFLETLPRTPGRYIFAARNSSKPVNIFFLFDRVRKAAGLPDLTPHQLRHAFGSRAAELGVDGFAIQTLLGHQDLRSTRRYVSMSRTASEAATVVSDDVTARLGVWAHPGPIPASEPEEPATGEPDEPPASRRTRWLDIPAVVERSGLSADTLTKLRRLGSGPDWTRVYGRIVYSEQEVEAWLKQREAAPHGRRRAPSRAEDADQAPGRTSVGASGTGPKPSRRGGG